MSMVRVLIVKDSHASVCTVLIKHICNDMAVCFYVVITQVQIETKHFLQEACVTNRGCEVWKTWEFTRKHLC